ncbi:hypothetical protein [Azohydromonas australica]|uniref:hypothetical protein n=1 Tax=Azohydromonas australica TaxID=364039 RepID=UPI0012ECACA8|nr:hypothetical protein [Azohydromonas australica]
MAAATPGTKTSRRVHATASAAAAKPPVKRAQQACAPGKAKSAEPLVITEFFETLEVLEQAAVKLQKMPMGTVIRHLKTQPAKLALQRQRTALRQARRMAAAANIVQTRLAQPYTAAVEEASAQETEALVQATEREADVGLRHMIDSGELVSREELSRRLGCTTQALSKALGAKRMFYVEYQLKQYFPAWLADPRFDRKQVEAVSRALGDLPGGAKLAFFRTPFISLEDKTPLQALANGKLEMVVRTAKGYAQA